MKKILSAILAVIMITTLCACNNEPEKNDNPDKNTVVETPTENKFENAEVGDYIEFGAYEQDNDTSNGKEPIEWLVLDTEEDRALIISKHSLYAVEYNEDHRDITWEECSLREWLNDEFKEEAFSDKEQSKISTVTIVAEDHPEHGTEAGNDTTDKIFLLSINEAKEYFDSDDDRICKPTNYAIARAPSWVDEKYDSCWWWLRSPGFRQYGAAYVSSDGSIYSYGGDVHYYTFGVRPALWITLDS